jgi:hypothetical protein
MEATSVPSDSRLPARRIANSPLLVGPDFFTRRRDSPTAHG